MLRGPDPDGWYTHDGGPKPFEDHIAFRPRIACVQRRDANKGEFTTQKWEWRWKDRKPGPGDIIEFQLKE